MIPHWFHWLAYMPGLIGGAVLIVLWPVELLINRIHPGTAYLGELPEEGSDNATQHTDSQEQPASTA